MYFDIIKLIFIHQFIQIFKVRTYLVCMYIFLNSFRNACTVVIYFSHPLILRLYSRPITNCCLFNPYMITLLVDYGMVYGMLLSMDQIFFFFFFLPYSQTLYHHLCVKSYHSSLDNCTNNSASESNVRDIVYLIIYPYIAYSLMLSVYWYYHATGENGCNHMLLY